jgi:hypothetical protein
MINEVIIFLSEVSLGNSSIGDQTAPAKLKKARKEQGS